MGAEVRSSPLPVVAVGQFISLPPRTSARRACVLAGPETLAWALCPDLMLNCYGLEGQGVGGCRLIKPLNLDIMLARPGSAQRVPCQGPVLGRCDSRRLGRGAARIGIESRGYGTHFSMISALPCHRYAKARAARIQCKSLRLASSTASCLGKSA